MPPLLLLISSAIAGDCKIYKGDYASYSKLIATIKNDKIYKGDYASYSKLIATGKDCFPRDLALAAGVLLTF